MDPQDVPEVFEMPQSGPNEESPVAVADLVLTALLGREAAVLHAEHHAPQASVGWFIAAPGLRTEQTEPPVVVSSSLGAFRSVLARFGHHYMGGQLYNGYAMRFLRQRGRVLRCHMYMSNTGQSGFWIEVYAALIAEPGLAPDGGPAMRLGFSGSGGGLSSVS